MAVARRQRNLSSAPIILVPLLFLTTPASATETVTGVDESQWSPRHLDALTVDLDYDYTLPETDWLSTVTMTHVPAGSLYVVPKGTQRLTIKHAWSQVRRFNRRHNRRSGFPSPRKAYSPWDGVQPSTLWWTRSWLDSMPTKKGGAPQHPYVHVVGRDIDWTLGPITISNTLKVKFDYVAAFSLNTDPKPPAGEDKPQPISIDVVPEMSSSTTLGTHVRVKVRPRIRVGLPKDNEWFSLLRNVSLRVELDLVHFGRHLLHGEVELNYKYGQGLSLHFGVALVAW